jgi:hypothetical protein
MRIILLGIMFLVKIIRRDSTHYLLTPEGIISRIKINRIMNVGHVIPSILATILIAIKIIPLLSVTYAARLEENDPVVFYTVLKLLVPIMILNGIIIESILEMTNVEYKTYKKGLS